MINLHSGTDATKYGHIQGSLTSLRLCPQLSNPCLCVRTLILDALAGRDVEKLISVTYALSILRAQNRLTKYDFM